MTHEQPQRFSTVLSQALATALVGWFGLQLIRLFLDPSALKANSFNAAWLAAAILLPVFLFANVLIFQPNPTETADGKRKLSLWSRSEALLYPLIELYLFALTLLAKAPLFSFALLLFQAIPLSLGQHRGRYTRPSLQFIPGLHLALAIGQSAISSFQQERTALFAPNAFKALLYSLAALVVLGLLAYLYQNTRVVLLEAKEAKFRQQLSLLIPIVALILYILGPFFGMLDRSLQLYSPNFDHGLFVQSFEQLSSVGAPFNWAERDAYISHLQVHFSPIFYLLTPFYYVLRALFKMSHIALAPSLALQALQGLVVLSGLIPLILLLRRSKLSRLTRMLLLGLYILAPGLIGSGLYDFHENCCLAPALLWLLLALQARRRFWLLPAVALVLSIKEDAALYLLAIGCWSLFAQGIGRRERLLRAALLLLLPLAYFLGVSYYLNHYGYGIMNFRFENLLTLPQLGLLGLPLALLQNPSYFLGLIADPAKSIYLLIQGLSFGALAFRFRSPAQIFLLVPLFLINLCSVYPYQHNIAFQYHYGTTVLFLLLVLSNLEADDPNKADDADASAEDKESPALRLRRAQSLTLVAALLFSLFFSASILPGNLQTYLATSRRPQQRQMEQQLNRLVLKQPHGPYLASTMLIAPLASLPEGYEIGYHHEVNGQLEPDPSIRFILIDRRFALDKKIAPLLERYKALGYVSETLAGGQLELLKKP